MRHVSFRSSLSVPVLPRTVALLASFSALVNPAGSTERFVSSEDRAEGIWAVLPTPVALAAHDPRGPAPLAVE